MHRCLPYAAEDLSTAGCRRLAPPIEIQVLRADSSMRVSCAVVCRFPRVPVQRGARRRRLAQLMASHTDGLVELTTM